MEVLASYFGVDIYKELICPLLLFSFDELRVGPIVMSTCCPFIPCLVD